MSRGPLHSRGWDAYLLAAAGLIPLIVPSGPSQVAAVDVLNAAALACFAGMAMVHPVQPRWLFVVPVMLIAIGSLLALMNAVSVSAGLLTLAQDLYLYLWFVVLVTVMARRPGLKRVRLVWLLAADAIAIASITQWMLLAAGAPGDLLSREGPRVAATFYNANMLADYLMLSVFIGLGLVGQAPNRVLVPSLALLFLALLTTKSNGGLISLAVGTVVWLVARAWAAGTPAVRLAGMSSLVLAAWLGLAWLHEWGVGQGLVRRLDEQSVLGRVHKSGASRQVIWINLAETYQRSPLGLGPGNSAHLMVPIGRRQHRDSFQSQEPHNDYLAYIVERGPLALGGLLIATAAAFHLVMGARLRIAQLVGGRDAGAALWASLLGALVAVSVHSLVIEKMHFRHFWMFLAIACALALQRPGHGVQWSVRAGSGAVT